MKKIVLLSTILLLVTGCSIVKLSDNNIEKNIDTIMSEKSNLHNVYYNEYLNLNHLLQVLNYYNLILFF